MPSSCMNTLDLSVDYHTDKDENKKPKNREEAADNSEPVNQVVLENQHREVRRSHCNPGSLDGEIVLTQKRTYLL